ncbi:GIY-YIG nuclease family protein [Alteromonas sp. 1_MG-2023]|uniref:GIY-YIG nuclease family protein n=1 Tax=Alteromonas sp. 1_MG-2023 TaxID=3062669 RepID=UPI0026E224C4|nr:GIY-YIG nuclease family protein [Alteromonas sp. 1_MG-2023]MDO6477373.1 GIY-YIG nuclease family protein [Alteromonas sp. 1_MG-2023]
MNYNFALLAFLLFVIIVLMVAHRYTAKQRLFNKLISNAKSRSSQIIREAKAEKAEIDADINRRIEEINARESASESRIERLKEADKEIRARLRESRALIDNITDLSCQHAADIELLTEEDLQSSKSYVDDRKAVKSRLKKLATDAIDNVRGHNADVNIGKFVAISAKADMAGALLLSVVEMLCSKVTASSGHLAAEKLAETIIATEALVKAIDSRAEINIELKALLMKRLEIEINYKKAKQIAKEEQRELREQQREEKKAREEAMKAQIEAEKEEAIKAAAIAKLETELAEKSEQEKLAFQEQLDVLKSELALAHEKLERAKSRAQETKQGHVYVISNIGSFGKDVLKIGMTRRLEPMDRVRELGDASVPFTFDVHALIESDDAPHLESTLHRVFDTKRLNRINRRKEFFRVSIDDIEKELNKMDIDALISRVPSADEYYQTLKILDKDTNLDFSDKKLNQSESAV